MKFFKKYKLLIFIIISFILGFLLGPLIHDGFFIIYLNSFKIRWYYHIIMFFSTLFLTLALHELTHLISFVLSGFKNEAIIILFLLFYKNTNNKWRMKIDFKLLLLGGGMVMPDLGEINNDDDYNKALKAMRTSLIAAPLFTLISGLLFFLIAIVFFYYNKIVVPLSFYILLFSLFYTYLSSKESNQVYGDFKAFKRIKERSSLSTLFILQYANKLTPYLKNELYEHLNVMPINQDFISLAFFNALLDEAIFELDELDFFLYERVYYYVLNPTRFSRLCSNTSNFGLCQSIIFYLDKLGFSTDAIRLSNTLLNRIDKSGLSDKSKLYLTNQTIDLLNLANHKDYISNPKNISRDSMSFILNSIPSFIETELYKNNGYKKLYLESKIN